MVATRDRGPESVQDRRAAQGGGQGGGSRRVIAQLFAAEPRQRLGEQGQGPFVGQLVVPRPAV